MAAESDSRRGCPFVETVYQGPALFATKMVPIVTEPFSCKKSEKSVKYATIGPIGVYLPERVETNDQLRAEYPKWDMDLIFARTGIARRHLAFGMALTDPAR